MAMDQRDVEVKSERLDIRVSPRERRLIQAASESAKTKMAEFMRMTLLKAAEAELADRRLFVLSPEKWDAFAAALDEAPRDMPKLRELAETTSRLGE